MARRKLSSQQQARISRRQRQEVLRGRIDDGENFPDGPRLRGIVTCNFGQQLEVKATDTEHSGQLFRCFQRSNLPPLVSGDRVVFTCGGGGTNHERAEVADGVVIPDGVVIGQEPRTNVFSRPAADGQLKPVAANIDLVLVVLAPSPRPFLNMLDRYLVAIEHLGLRPLIVINKSDLVAAKSLPVLDTVGELYPRLGYTPVTVSAKQESGLDELQSRLLGKTTVIVGQSGVGKSSLINALSRESTARVGALSTAADKGTHTTTAARLFHLAGFDLIDSPGIREFGLWHIAPKDLLTGFVEFRPFLGRCRFRDCSHQGEPDCALQQAVAAGEIARSRLDSYFQILGSLASS